MHRSNCNDEIISGTDNQHFRRIRSDWFHKTRQPAVPDLYEQTITTTTKTTVNKELNATTDEMITTHLEKSPIRRVNLVSGPQSAYARLFPDRYQQEQEELLRTKQRSKSTDSQRYNFDRVLLHQRTSDDDCDDAMRKSRHVSFYNPNDEEFLVNQNELSTRTRSFPCLNERTMEVSVNHDPNPEVIYQNNPDEVVYVQRVGVRYLEPPTPPPPEPIIIREIQPAHQQELPPLILSTTPPISPRTPSPLIVREAPPTPPPHQPTKIITKTLPALPALPRRVIIKRVPPLPAKPRPVIIEKWLPYKPPAERPVIYERAEQSEQTHTTQRNVILQYEPARVRIEQDIQNVGCYRVDPEIYRAQFGSTLRRSGSIRKVLEDIGCNPDVITSKGYQTCESASNQANNLILHDDSQQPRTCFSEQQLSGLIDPSTNMFQHYDVPTPCGNNNGVYYTTVLSNS